MSTPPKIKYREQGVDELLQFKLHQALAALDGPPPPNATIDGFLRPVRTALKKGWRVELYAWEEGLSRAWMPSPVGGCHTLDLVLDSLYPIAVPSTSPLFFFRVRAIYTNSHPITIVFALLWITETACITIPFGTAKLSDPLQMRRGLDKAASTSGPRRYCTIAELAPYLSSVSITPTVFDIAVFVAILYRFISNTHVNYTFSDKCRAFFSGVYLPSFSKALFVDGQKYYMITVISNIAMSAMIDAPGLSPGLRSILAPQNVMLTSIMACRVYRHTRLDHAVDMVIPSSSGAPAKDTLPIHFATALHPHVEADTVKMKSTALGEGPNMTTSEGYSVKKAAHDAV
ncbi:hypothetical protein B0H11DRAFT_2283858 [Mycena galericulata]|nr:hypothetical protein B0H11DRAFT_2283858 [Mycena galericulata]